MERNMMNCCLSHTPLRLIGLTISLEMTTNKLRIGYVPEHFSIPLVQLADSPWGQEHITLVSQPSGTGQMLTSFNGQDPSARTIDVAVALTEALIAGIAKGRSDYTLAGTYVKSSLNWAVITGTDEKASRYNSINDLRSTPIGISRVGSGSQIMASVMALQHGWTNSDGSVQEIPFKVNDTFENLRKGVNQVQGLESSAFMWEWFTTKPYVDSKEVRFIGNVPTPWPSWTIACSNAVSDADHKTLESFQQKLEEKIVEFTSLQNQQASLKAIEQHFSYKPEDVQQWWSNVRWVQDQREPLAGAQSMKGQDARTSTVSKAVLMQTLDLLGKAGVVQPPSDGWQPEMFASSTRLVD